MDLDSDKSWKDDIGFPINYNSDEDLDTSDVVIRNPSRSARFLLADHGDGAEADLFGTTPPRTRIRINGRRKTLMDSDFTSRMQTARRGSYDPQVKDQVASPDRINMKRGGLKLIRTRERDWKQENKSDSLPLNPPEVRTLVESCNRFMSLTSRLKCREAEGERAEEAEGQWGGEGLDSRENFHRTFCMLINMGNMDKNCKRSLSREEQVWQNERKDLIWLELRAKIAGRTLAQQDAYLCTQRKIVPDVIRNILEYKFVNPHPCKGDCKRLCTMKGPREELASDDEVDSDVKKDYDILFGCLALNCQLCNEAISAALREVRALLERYHAALALYPSGNALTHDHPLVATDEFKNRLNAMCVWYNVALHLRVKVLAVRRILRAMQLKEAMKNQQSLDLSREQSMEPKRPCQVTFASDNTSNNSDSSAHSREEQNDGGSSDEQGKVVAEDCNKTNVVEKERDEDDTNESQKIDAAADEVDHEIDKVCSLPTPEIVVSDSQYSTTDSAGSADTAGSVGTAGTADSGYGADDALDVGSLEDLVRLRLLGKCEVSPYRQYHNEKLKTQGVRRSMMFIHKIRKHLNKAYLTFDKLDDPQLEGEQAQADGAELFVEARVADRDEAMDTDIDETQEYELRRYGCWSAECLAMCLPSYRNHFLLLTSICMEAVHDYLSLRLEDRPERLSCLTVKQLMHELKEGLETARLVRASFAQHVRASLRGLRAQRGARADLARVRAEYDATVHTVLKQYLSYVRTMSLTEHVPRAALDAQWAFTARLARHFPRAALLAPPYFTDVACNQLDRIKDQIEKNMRELEESAPSEPSEPPATVDPEELRLRVYAACRAAQRVYACEREAALQAAQWARVLAARLAAPAHAHLDHRARIFESLMSIRRCVVQHAQEILQRSRGGRERLGLGEQVGARVRELLLQLYKLAFELHKVLFEFAQAPFRQARRHRPTSLQPVRAQAVGCGRRRPETMLVHDTYNMIHKELHRFVSDSERAAGAAGAAPGRLLRADSVLAEHDHMFDHQHQQKQNSIERLLWEQQEAGESEVETPVEGAAECGAVERQWAGRAARAVTQLARCWMGFVLERYDRGRGLRPRWASQGLEFLTLACDPCNTKHLTDEEFEDLKQLMDQCISHVVGSRPSSTRIDPVVGSPTPMRHRQRSPLPSADGSTREPGPPSLDLADLDPLGSLGEVGHDAHTRRVLRAIGHLDHARDEKLHDMKTVGKVMEAAVTSYEPKLRQVTFKWQRGLKIGAGTFGKVYTVVNTETGQLLAMKEISVVAGDRRALQRAAHELRVLEGLIHPHLVRYYGCEVHREEMLIFMELCVEGSLEALVAGGGALGEPAARRYTRQLLGAVAALHQRNIAHRDIKSGNVFLTNEGHCLKLGDFGCAVKIRANTTAAGELQGYVGTQAYMAPEVFMKSSGHGRAADIWSLGCVVTEMTSGKRPFSEYDSNYQIMFVVGMGGRPAVPPSLSPEGADFCARCLAHEPAKRPRAEDLLHHHFLMVKSDDDCKCYPGMLVTPSMSRED